MDFLNIIHICSFQTLLFVLLIVTKPNKSQPDWWLLAFFLATFVVAQVKVMMLGNGQGPLWMYLSIVPVGFWLFPTIYGYILSHQRRIDWSFSLHFFPGMLVLICLIYSYNGITNLEKDILANQFRSDYTPIWANNLGWDSIIIWLIAIRMILIGAICPTYMYLSWKTLKRYETKTKMHFSHQENISLCWLNKFMILLFTGWLLTLTVHTLVFFICP